MNKRIILLSAVAIMLSACNMKEKFEKVQEQTSGQFADQHFKTAVSLIELYKIRNGYYPASIDSISYMGAWDQMIGQSVVYEKLDTGYRLDVRDALMFGKAKQLVYPADFWQGTGVKKSNVMGGSEGVKNSEQTTPAM